MQQNVLFSKMIEYFLENGIITQKDIADFVSDFQRQSEEDILKTKNPLHNRVQDKQSELDEMQRRMMRNFRETPQ